MTLKSRIALAAAATMLWPLAAGAADYDPPVVIDEAPEYVPVEVGSGWYLRGDVGYNITKSPYDFTLFGVESESTFVNGSIGAGYHFTDYLRGDLNLGFLAHDRYSATNGIDTIQAENSMWTGMANAYVDLGTIAGFTPYVGAGVGVIYASQRVDDTSTTPDWHFRDTQYALAYALNAGVSYKVSQNASVDVGYQYLASPGLEYADVPAVEMKKGVDFHQVRVGLRYDLW
jgi:outer membrane autotransporter protein